jgi:signal peptidase II
MMTVLDRRLFRLGLAIIALVVLADQATKAVVMRVMEQHPFGFPVLPVFNMVSAWNPGVSFSMFRHAGPLILSVGAVVVALSLVFWLTRIENLLTAVGVALVAGGALGNVIDRIRAGAVFDFLDFYIRTGDGREWHWPAFNLADSAICVGVALLLLDGLFHRTDRAKTKQS